MNDANIERRAGAEAIEAAIRKVMAQKYTRPVQKLGSALAFGLNLLNEPSVAQNSCNWLNKQEKSWDWRSKIYKVAAHPMATQLPDGYSYRRRTWGLRQSGS